MERLEYSLEDADLTKFSLKLVQSKIISKDVKDNFDCLDSAHLEADIQARYLLQQVCERVREDDKVYDRLVRKVLSTLGGGVKDVCEAMRKELDRVEEGRVSSGAESGGVSLTAKNVPYLVKLLASGSHRWELIGIALGVPEYVRDECRDCRYNPSKLSHILTAWITGSYNGARPATVDVLREALASEVVEFRKLVEYLNEFNSYVETSIETRLQSLESLPQIECQSYDSEVAEGRSTLLEVQVSSSGCESYQWIKDGQPLLDGADFLGVSSNMLYINRASQGTAGKYSCCVRYGSETVCSDEINLMVIKLSIEEVDLVKLSDCLVNSEVISRCIYNKFVSLDQVHLEPDIKVRYLLQQVCERVREDDKVYDRIVKVLRRLDGILRNICEIMRKRVDRDKESKDIYAGTTYCSLLELEISINPVPTTNRVCSNIDPEMYTAVAECKSTLLEAQVSSNGYESYQWSKYGQSLLDGADFSGVSSNILYINRASQGTEGKYSCCVSNGSETVCSDEINLMVIYPPEKEHLIKLYSFMESEVPIDSWPPVGNSTFINLVLIKQSRISRCDYYTVRGDMDDILESKEVVEYEEVFKEYREGALVLVEGRPGSGKTTLVHKMTRDWATGRKVLQGAKMVFLITLRLLNFSGRDRSLLDILEEFYYGEVLRKKIEHDLHECGGKGACFIIDGLDEYQHKNKKESVIYQLIYKQCLRFSMVIVASRPVATDEVKKYGAKRIEVIGFTKSQIYDYVETYPFNGSDKVISDMVSKLKLYLSLNLKVLHMCYLPVHAAMICFLFSQLEGNMPHTETQIYEQFTLSTLLRQMTRTEEPRQLKSLKDLCGKEKKDFKLICKLAYHMIIKSQQVVSQSDTPVPFSDFTSSVLGLLTVERTFRHYGVEHLYTFTHLTFQEYLAAFHIAGFEEHQQINKIAGNSGDKKLKNVRKFYCGLLGLEKSVLLKNKTFLQSLLGQVDFLSPYQFQCAFESQQFELCDYVVGEGSLKLGEFITPSDFAALGYVISTASQHVSGLDLRHDTWDYDGIMALSSLDISDKLRSIKCLKVFVSSPDDMCKALNSLLLQLPLLEKLDLRGYRQDKFNIGCLTSNITLSNLSHLMISLPLAPCSHPEKVLKLLTFGSHNIKQVYITITDILSYVYDNYALWRKWWCYAFGFQVFLDSDISWVHLYNSESISSIPQERFSYCSEVVVINCGIDDEGAEILAIRLNTSILEKLVLDFNRISDSGAVALAWCIARCSVVQEVSIQCNSIGDLGTIALADALVHCSSLKRLDLQGNGLGDEGAVAIAKAADGLPNLDLYLHNVNITEEGVERVLEHRASTKIRAMVFGLAWDVISNAGIDALKSALKCGTLPTLKIRNNKDISELDQNLMRNTTGLDCEWVSDDSVPILCGIIKSMDKLQHLKCGGIGHISSTSAQLLGDILSSCKFLCSVSLSGLQYYSMSVHSILLGCNNLRSPDMSYCYLGSEGVTSLFCDLKSCVNLHTLDLGYSEIGSDGAQLLSKVLVHCKNLRFLDLSSNDLGDSGCLSLAEGLQNHTSLLKLKLGNNNITSDGIGAMIPVFKQNHLQHLDLPKCDIGSAPLVDVMCADTLQTLELSSNTLGLGGAIKLGVGLQKCRQLMELDISCNSIGSFGMSYLSKGLKCCRQIVKLNISSNNIGSYGLSFLVEGLMCCRQLVELDFSSNNIGYGLSFLADGLQHCINLQVLNLTRNIITSDGIAAINVIMKRCRYLRKLDIRENSIDMDGAAVLVGGWQHRSILKLYLSCPLGYRHESALLNVERCCSSCNHLLEQYFNNDYVVINYGYIDMGIPKLVSSS